jgi:antibiotic biosynthesis monooxygenase (ABM) superfamily enzyme
MTDRGPTLSQCGDRWRDAGNAWSAAQYRVIPLAKKTPGLRKYDISTGEVGAPAGPSGIHLVATLYFDSLDAIKAGLASPQRQARGRRSCQLCGRGRGALLF